jgi:WD40-like Beta Propeller Repeat
VRFWRLALTSLMGTSLLTGVVIYAVRLPDTYACVQLNNAVYSGRPWPISLIDMGGNSMVDRRIKPYGNPLDFSPDQKYVVYLQPTTDDNQLSDLVLQRWEDQKPVAEPTVIQEKMLGGNRFNLDWFTGTVWSPDSKRLAYVWPGEDGSNYMTILAVDGLVKQTVPLSFLQVGYSSATSPLTLRWSPDGAYLAFGRQLTFLDWRYVLWSVAERRPVTPVEGTPFLIGAWSPQGHQFAAYLRGQDDSRSLLIWSPEREVKVAVTEVPDQIYWSPDSRYIALQSRRPCTRSENCGARWVYDIYARDGSPLATNVEGLGAGVTSSLRSLQEQMFGGWTQDSRAWVFLQKPHDPTKTVQDLVALYVAERRYEVIASNIVADVAAEIFHSAPREGIVFYSPNNNFFNDPAIAPRIVIPTWHNGKVRVELADSDGKHRTTLVEGAQNIILLPSNFRASYFYWGWRDDVVAFAAMLVADDHTTEARLMWAQADGSAIHVIDGLRAITNFTFGTDNMGYMKWLAYIGSRQARLSLEYANVLTGEYHPLVENLKDMDGYWLTRSPDDRAAAVTITTRTLSGILSSIGDLYLVALDGSRRISLGKQVGIAAWSPDSAALAFIQYGVSPGMATTLNLVTSEGSMLRQIPLRQPNSRSELNLWTKCY